MALAQDIEGIFTDYAAHHFFSGVGLVKTQQSVIFAKAFGYANQSWKVTNTLETRFDTASITKLFTTVAILQLVDQQRLALDTRVVDFLHLRDTTISKQVTVYHLLTHTSGIADDADEEAGEDYSALWREKPNYSVRETKDFLPQFVHKPPVFAPGAGCRYNNVGFILLGLIIETLSGRSYREYIRTAIFEPLGMNQTEFVSMDGVFDHVAEGYAAVYDAIGNLSGWRKNIYDYPPIGSPDGGAYSTAMDLDRFIRALLAGDVLSEDLTQALFTPKVFYRESGRYRQHMGFCFHFFTESDDETEIIFLKKDGDNAGVSCIFSYYPQQDLTLVVLANQDCDIWRMSWEVHDLILTSDLAAG